MGLFFCLLQESEWVQVLVQAIHGVGIGPPPHMMQKMLGIFISFHQHSKPNTDGADFVAIASDLFVTWNDLTPLTV